MSKTTTIRISKELRDKVKELSKENDMTIQGLLETAVSLFCRHPTQVCVDTAVSGSIMNGLRGGETQRDPMADIRAKDALMLRQWMSTDPLKK